MDTSAPGNKHDQANVRYEQRDARFVPLLVSVASLLLLLAVVVVATSGVFQWLAAGRPRTAAVLTAAEDGPASQLQQLRQKENEVLNSYGWVSREEGIVRIPIERAMELAVEDASKNDDE